MGFTQGRFRTADGPNLEFRDYAPLGPVSGPPVLCLHGLTRNLRDFEALAPMIAGLGRRVIAPSQRGRGGSDFDPEPARYTPAVYTQDMLALLDHLSIEAATFVGTSMGGIMTMIAAAIAPQRVAGAVLNDIGAIIDPAGLERIRAYVGEGTSAASWDEAAARARAVNGEAFPMEEGPAFWEAFARRLFREEGPGRIVLDYDPAIAASVQPGASVSVDMWPLFLALAPIPTLLVRGAISDLLSAETAAEMARRKPDLSVVTVPGVGHAPFLTEPAAWAALAAFLNPSTPP